MIYILFMHEVSRSRSSSIEAKTIGPPLMRTSAEHCKSSIVFVANIALLHGREWPCSVSMNKHKILIGRRKLNLMGYFLAYFLIRRMTIDKLLRPKVQMASYIMMCFNKKNCGYCNYFLAIFSSFFSTAH